MMEDFNGGRPKRVRPDNYDVSPYLRRNNTQYEDNEVLAIAADDPGWDRNSLPDPVGNEGNNDESGANNDQGDKPPKHNRLKAYFASLSRKQWLIIAAVFLVVAGACAAAFILTRPDATPAKAAKSAAKPAPVPTPPPVSPLTGLDTTAEDAKRPVIGVMIENSTFARPQSGLEQAGVVYEAIAEYGITRFLALFQEAAPGNIGPIRSARPYYVDWANAYEAAYAHVGGSPDALAKIKTDSIRDLDQFANAGAYRRTAERDAPHNVYSTAQNLRELTASKGWTASAFTGLSRKKPTAVKQTAIGIDFAISGPTYDVHYDYDPNNNKYLRTMGGEPHTDADSGARIAPSVVIGLVTQYGLLPDGYHSSYATTGTGAAKIFQNGTVTEVTWKRDTPKSQYVFSDAAGKPVALNPGQVWFTVVGDPAAITFTAPAAAPATP